MGHRIAVNQLCTATAIVYMHRFFMVHSFKSFQRFTVATAALFLAAKVEEQPRKLHMLAKISHAFQNKDTKPLEDQSEVYKKLMEDISYCELVLLQTLGFEVAVEHPHQHVVKGMQLVRASKDLSQTAYFMSHNSLLLTTFSIQYPPTVVACVCIHLACRWKGIEIPLSADGKPWWQYVDKNVTLEQLNSCTGEFLKIYEMCPSKLQKKIMESVRMGQQSTLKPGESSRGHSSKTSSEKLKAPQAHSSKQKPQGSSHPQQKPHKSGAHVMPPKHPVKNTAHHNSTQNGAHASHNSHSEVKHKPSAAATSQGSAPRPKHYSREEYYRHKLNSGSKPGAPSKHHSISHHSSAKPPDPSKQRPDIKHRPSTHPNSLKRSHQPTENHSDPKRIKLEDGKPPLPSQQMELPPLPPPLPSDPPPDFLGDLPPLPPSR